MLTLYKLMYVLCSMYCMRCSSEEWGELAKVEGEERSGVRRVATTRERSPSVAVGQLGARRLYCVGCLSFV